MSERGPETAASTPSATLPVDILGPDDSVIAVEVIADAFSGDPTWSWALPQQAARTRFWEFAIAGALGYPWTFKTSDFRTVSVWIPPGGTEFSHDQEAQLPGLLAELVGTRAGDDAELMRRFDEAHPRTEPHYYLSLLGAHSEHRRFGLGMALLRDGLARIDADPMPAYLESSNPANNYRYESVGFKPIVSFQAPGEGPAVTGMWRPSC